MLSMLELASMLASMLSVLEFAMTMTTIPMRGMANVAKSSVAKSSVACMTVRVV